MRSGWKETRAQTVSSSDSPTPRARTVRREEASGSSRVSLGGASLPGRLLMIHQPSRKTAAAAAMETAKVRKKTAGRDSLCFIGEPPADGNSGRAPAERPEKTGRNGRTASLHSMGRAQVRHAKKGGKPGENTPQGLTTAGEVPIIALCPSKRGYCALLRMATPL